MLWAAWLFDEGHNTFGISVTIIAYFITLYLFNTVLIFKIIFTSSALILLFNFDFTTFIWWNTHSISGLECGIGIIICIEQNQPVFLMGFLQWHLHTSILQFNMPVCQYQFAK